MARRDANVRELMDDPAVDRAELARSLRFIRRVNRFLGGTHAVMRHFHEWSQHWNPGEQISVLDVATGSADIPLAIHHWAKHRGFSIDLIGLDLHPTTLELAKDFLDHAPIKLLRGDALVLPFADQSIDYVMSSMFFHHLTDAQVIRVLREMTRVARRGVIVNDLLHTRFATIGIWALTLFAGRIDKHDARVSVQKAWDPHEVQRWGRAAGVDWLTYRYHFPARFTLAGQRPVSPGQPSP